MLTEKETKSSNYIRIISILKSLRDDGIITFQEYTKAKGYYRNVTGADIVILD